MCGRPWLGSSSGTSTSKRDLVGTEQRFATVIELADGQSVQLTGYADRLELDADGHVVVVDLKTARTVPTHKSVLTHRQLALYQLAVDHGALDESLGEGRRSGGAELVQLGQLDDGPAVVQPQPVMPEDGRERDALRTELQRTAEMIRLEVFPATPGQHCRDCTFVPICPARSAGSVVAQ